MVDVVQLVEHRIVVPSVVGSSPIIHPSRPQHYAEVFFIEIISYLCPMDQNTVHTLQDFFSKQPVLKAWVFGSFSRGEDEPGSDIDILVLLDRSQPIGLKFFGMVIDLERLLNRPVDLVVDGDLLPFARESADRDKVMVYERAS